MTGRRFILPLALAAVTHWMGASLFVRRFVDPPLATSSRAVAQQVEPVLPDPPKIKFGRDGPTRSTVAWIPYEDFRKLVAPQSKTHQPALQTQVDPVPNARVVPDPTPPSVSGDRPSVGDPAPQPSVDPVADSRRAQHAKPSQGAVDLAAGGPLATTRQLDPRRSESPEPDTRDNRQAQPVQATRAGSSTARPTAAARSDRESSPTRLQMGDNRVVPGGVVVGPGIEVKTIQPRFSMVAQVSAAPSNPVAVLVFDHRDGRVIKATIVRSSGYGDIDAPVLASLYKWRAQGSRLEQLGQPFEVRIELILSGR